jgi:hypothetical protein
MTVQQLLTNTDSVELSHWLKFFQVDAQLADERRRRADEDRRIMGDG